MLILTLLCVCTAVLIASMSAPFLLLAYCRQHFAQGLVSVLLLNLRANRPAFVLCVDMGKQLIKKRPSSFFPAAKKGKTRFLLKNNLTKTPVSNKALTKKWRETPYVKNPVNFRLDRLKWKRNLKDFIGADEDKMVKILTEDGFLPDWTRMTCPFCNKGAVSGLHSRDQLTPRYRCRRKACQKFILPQHLHPFFTSVMGPEGHSLAVQASALLLRLAGVPLSSIHLLLDINHKALEKMEKNLALTRKSYVESEQAHMVLGTGKGTKWTEIEADEAVFDKCLIAAEDVSHPSRTMKWDQWLGMVPRGKPSSLVLFRLRSLTTHKRAPGPGAVRKDDWVKIANAWLKDRSIILHTDSARSYRTKIRGVLHDAVIHQKKRIFHGGKWVWKSPTFVRLAKHKLPNGRKITVKAGTQVIDRAWRFLKDRVKIN